MTLDEKANELGLGQPFTIYTNGRRVRHTTNRPAAEAMYRAGASVTRCGGGGGDFEQFEVTWFEGSTVKSAEAPA